MLSTTYRPRVGGMETHVATLAEALVLNGHQVCVFTNRDSPSQPQESVENGVRILRAGALLDGWSDPDAVPWEAALFGLLRDVEHRLVADDYDVIHAHAQASLLLAAMSGVGVHLPIVASPHETRPEIDPCGIARSRFIYGCGAADLVIVGSRRFAEQVTVLGTPEHRIRVVHHGLPVVPHALIRASARQMLHEQLGVAADRVLVSLVGRFKARKGHLRFVDAIDVMTTRSQCAFVLAGSCSSADRGYLDAVRKRVAALEDSADVTIAEDISDPIRNLLWAASDIATQPSTHEGLGLAAVEAMRAGVPVIASDIDGLREVVADDTGALVDTADSAAYATALDKLVNDQALRTRIGTAGRIRVEKFFSVERLVAETVAVYHEAISLRRPR